MVFTLLYPVVVFWSGDLMITKPKSMLLDELTKNKLWLDGMYGSTSDRWYKTYSDSLSFIIALLDECGDSIPSSFTVLKHVKKLRF